MLFSTLFSSASNPFLQLANTFTISSNSKTQSPLCVLLSVVRKSSLAVTSLFPYPGIIHHLQLIPTHTTRVSPVDHCLSTPFLTHDLIIMVAPVIDVTPYFHYPSLTPIEGEPTFMAITQLECELVATTPTASASLLVAIVFIMLAIPIR